MASKLLLPTKEWRRKLVAKINPYHDWHAHQVTIRHGRHGTGESYAALLHHPPDALLDELLSGDRELTEEVRKAVGERKDCPDGRWITVHPHGDEEEGQPVKICPNPDGTHTIVTGAGGKLNGLRLDHVKSPQEYRLLAKQRRAERRQQQKLQDEMRRHQLGNEEFARQQLERQARQAERESAHKEAEQAYIEAVAKAQGIDPARFALSPEATATAGSAEIADAMARRTHEAALTWANEVVRRTRGVVIAAYHNLARDALGDVAMKAITEEGLGDSGKGYAAHLQQLSEEHGLSAPQVQEQQETTSMLHFLSTSNGDLQAARAKRESVVNAQAKRQETNAQVRQASQAIAEQHGQGPQAVQALDTMPQAANVEAAVAVLQAAQKLKEARQAAEEGRRQLDATADLRTLPKAAVVPARESTPEEQLKAIADSLTQEAQHQAMLRIVTTSNDIEAAQGTLREHLSVGQAAAFGAIGQAVDGSSLDPLTMDVLGPSAAAQVLVAKWRATMPPEEFKAMRDALAAQHIATQERIANEGADRAETYLASAAEIPDVEPTDGTTLQAALNASAQKAERLRRAREAAGVARGRLEAAAAINDAMMRPANQSVMVSLGPIATRDALQQAYAIGLTEPTRYDDKMQVKQAGQFTIHSDGENRILEIHPEGLTALGKQMGGKDVERARRSAAIKNGKEDDPNWLPEGIARRPATTFDLDPLAIRSIDHALQVKEQDSPEQMAQALQEHIGARINAGQDPFDVQSDIHSAAFIAGLGLSPEAEARYQQVAMEVAPYKLAGVQDTGTTRARADFREAFAAHREALRQKLESYADDYVDAQKRAGKLSSDDAALDKQRLPLDATVQDCAYQAALADPRTSYAFSPIGDLNRQARDAIRSYAFEKLFGLDPKDQEIVTPLTEPQRHAYAQWQAFKQQVGDPYAAIQKRMQEADSENTDLFGESQVNPLATVDLGNPAQVLQVGRENAAALGYEPIIMPDGSKAYPFLEPGRTWQEVDGGGRMVEMGPRTEETIASELRGRIRQQLRAFYLSAMVGSPDLAAQGFNPESVVTASDRWGQYCQDMGGEKRALKTVQEAMAGELVSRFAAAYGQRTGKSLAIANRNYTYAQNHAEAMLGAQEREAITARKRERYAEVGKNARGRFTEGERRGKVEQQEQAEEEGAKLFGESEAGARKVNVQRPTIGRAAEGALRAMMPYIDTNRPLEVASNVTMAGKAINRQRATKLILQNKRQGLCLQAGGGKTLCGIGAFTEAHAKGQAHKALYVVPSNIVGQFGSEFYKFVDPASGLRWHADPSASASERQAAYANPAIHACVTTPEALREDVTEAVAQDLGVSPEAARDRLAHLSPEEQDHLIHSAMEKRGWDFDFSMLDEGHRLLGRAGKPDAHMARIADSVGRKTPYMIHSTADLVKNDASECWSVLSKLDPERYRPEGRDAFLRKYSRNTLASGLALQREMEPYIYTAPVDIGVTHDRILHTGEAMKLTPAQQEQYAGVLRAYNVARAARAIQDPQALRQALQTLSPSSFQNGELDNAQVMQLARSLGTLRDAALNRVVNTHPEGVKLHWVLNHLEQHKGAPTVIFAHNLAAVRMLTEQLKARGHRVATITGDMAADAKERARLAFSPPNGEAQADVLVSSDAGSVGANLQRGSTLINYDTPQTAMCHEQRIARELRQGQKNHVTVHDLVADAEYDKRARRRLEEKGELRELMTTPAELIDDDGLAMRIEQARIQAFEEAYGGRK